METRLVDSGHIMKVFHAVLKSSDLIPQGMKTQLKYFTWGKGMSRRALCSDEYVDPNLHHWLLEKDQRTSSPASPRSKLPGEVGVPKNMGELLP